MAQASPSLPEQALGCGSTLASPLTFEINTGVDCENRGSAKTMAAAKRIGVDKRT